MTEYTIVADNDAHRYIIPADRLSDWYTFTAIPSDDERSWEVPDFAERLDGGRVVFKEWRIV